MIEKFAVFQWKAKTFTIWKDNYYFYRNLDNNKASMAISFSGVDKKNTTFKLKLLG